MDPSSAASSHPPQRNAIVASPARLAASMSYGVSPIMIARKISARASAMRSPSADSSLSPANSLSSLSPPFPISGRTPEDGVDRLQRMLPTRPPHARRCCPPASHRYPGEPRRSAGGSIGHFGVAGRVVDWPRGRRCSLLSAPVVISETGYHLADVTPDLFARHTN